MPLPLFIVLLIALPLLLGAIFDDPLVPAIGLGLVLAANPIVRIVRKNRYFGGEHFQQIKREIASIVTAHNEVVNYVAEIRALGSFELGESASGQYAHLATFENTSEWNNRRDRHVATYAPHVHNASLQVVRNAKAEPIKYLMKYFGIRADKETLADLQRVADDIARLESAVANVGAREHTITSMIDPPAFILKHYAAEFWQQVGIHLSPVSVPYPQYKFEYTSAGGNASQTTSIELNTPTLEALAETLAQRIRWAKSAAGQRALMTTKLRTHIKERDGYACLHCGVSVAAEPHLLLEIDHILPVSRGGLSTPDNLQTLCWKCNRSKGAKTVQS